MVRRALLAAIAVGIPLLWAFAPYGRTVDMIGGGVADTFAGAALRVVQEATQSTGKLGFEHAILAIGFLGLFAPLYPAVIAALLLAAPRRMAARPRWVWPLEGAIVFSLAGPGCVLAILYVAILMPGAPPPVLWFPLWLLPGCAAAGGLAAIWLGVARHGRFARMVFG